MSKFYAKKVEVASPTNKRATSPSSSLKRKPFVSTTKNTETFGTPPPLPPLPLSPINKSLSMNEGDTISFTAITEPDYISTSHYHLLQRQTVRWLNLSSTLWSLIVLDAQRSVDAAGVSQFLDVMSWRAHAVINEDEFSVLYSEWMTQHDKVTLINTSSSSSGGLFGKRQSVGVFLVRQLLFEKKVAESDLDLFTGIVIHEANTRLLNSSVSFMTKKTQLSGGRSQTGLYGLEVCTVRWLSLAEELFFALDTAGFGVLRFDEVFFLGACLVTGLRGWENEQELEADLSLASLVAIALQLSRDAGAQVLVNISGTGHPGDKGKRGSQQGKYEITLTMFKRFLIRKNLNEAALNSLIAHLKACVESTARICRAGSVEDLYSSCMPLDATPGVVGSPRLWQQAVLGTAGLSNSVSHTPGSPQFPPLVLFLLTDAERLIPGVLRANERPVNEQGFEGVDPEQSVYGWEEEDLGNDVLYETAYRIWSHFKVWGSDGASNKVQHNMLLSSGAYSNLMANGGMQEVHSDLAFQFILAALVQYKLSQHMLCAALFDVTSTQLTLDRGEDSLGEISALAVVCASLVPNARGMLVELGFGGMDLALSPEDNWCSPASSAGDEENFEETGQLSASLLQQFSGSVTAQSVSSVNSPPVKTLGSPPSESCTVPAAVLSPGPVEISSSTHNSANDVDSFAYSTGALQGGGHVSALPGAERRKSRLISLEAKATQVNSASPAVDPVAEVSQAKWLSMDATSTAKSEVALKSAAVRRRGTVVVQSRPHSAIEETAEPKAMSSASQLFASVSIEENKATTEVELDAAILSQREASLVNRLLTASDPAEQLALIAELKSMRGAPSATPSDPVMPKALPTDVRRPPSPPQSPSAQNLYQTQDDATASETSSVSAPNSIADLMEQGQSAGRYAQMLREILRKMSKDDSRVQLKSLEQVLQLGQNIAQLESNQLKKKPLVSASVPRSHAALNKGPHQPQQGVPSATALRDQFRHSDDKAVQQANRQRVAQNQSSAPFTVDAHKTAQSSPGGLVRLVKVPGHMPEGAGSGRKVSKVFGHPV